MLLTRIVLLSELIFRRLFFFAASQKIDIISIDDSDWPVRSFHDLRGLPCDNAYLLLIPGVRFLVAYHDDRQRARIYYLN